MPQDLSNGYDAIAREFIAVRSANGCKIVQNWAQTLSEGSAVLDIGAGSGEPLTNVLIELGLHVSAIDASPSMVVAFRQRFPDIEIACEPAEESAFFGKTFDGILAVGLIFLLPPTVQEHLIDKLAKTLRPGGRLLFSAPREACTWEDMLTGQISISLGAEAYQDLLSRSGLHLVDEYVDEGSSHYYDARKTA